MDRSKAYEILKSLNEKEYVTARDISESCEISIKTIRNRITDINKMLVYQKVGCIESRPHYGYKLRVHNNVKFKEFLENFTEAKQAVPENPQERAFGVLSILLNQRDCIVMETIAARLYISRTSISNTMREIEGMLEEYNLTLVRKSHNGIMIAGKEQDKRSLMNSLIEKDVYFYESQNPITIKVIQDMLKKIIQRNTEITIYSAAFDKLVVSVSCFPALFPKFPAPLLDFSVSVTVRSRSFPVILSSRKLAYVPNKAFRKSSGVFCISALYQSFRCGSHAINV